ncbi:putative quinol monooxygenase [Lutibacter sp.]|uniref:putative quinol monooxygenase n=1 Tax=Lutibacter sp. TaxID=1925666 RepID=UPI0027328285|nr:antibiotic biosynthesis monooxygenase family protein [Lutibacter sp.]MDP3314055.1 antibiotic biosynthesis monooxygenase family protein [Lutibacter sp.]
MFIRIVKMTFDSSKTELFIANFNQHKNEIRNFDGCHLLELYRDKDNTSIFFTYSYWESENHLETYRNSELFKKVWSITKEMFTSKAEAWSVDTIERLD